MPPTYRWFSALEAQGIEPYLMAMLDVARAKAGIPFKIVSGLRLPQHNIEVGGLPDSAHLPDPMGLSMAVDLACDNSLDRWRMVFALRDAGLTRIVLEDKHIHVDIDVNKPQHIVALYDKP